ncbi:MAG: hypothetical protein ACXAD7_09180 [Candidatus Kariarchaeaceae archaeon]|jgi:hypothetical protein
MDGIDYILNLNFNETHPNLCGLSQNEARILYSLVKWPHLSDQDMFRKIGMKRSTYQGIKSKLKQNEYYINYNVPDFPKIGFELLSLMFTKFHRSCPTTDPLFQDDFFCFNENNQYFRFSIAENLTQISINHEKLVKTYSRENLLENNELTLLTYPFATSRVYSFFDYEALLAKYFGYASEPYLFKKTISSSEKIKLSKAEKKVLTGLIKYPDEPNTSIATKIHVSRSTVVKAKQKFMKKGICLPRNIPDLRKLGFNVLVFSYFKFNPALTVVHRNDASELIRLLLTPFFYISNNLNAIVISAHTSFEQFEMSNDDLLLYYEKCKYILEEPLSIPISLHSMEIKNNINFYNPTSKILETECPVNIEQSGMIEK